MNAINEQEARESLKKLMKLFEATWDLVEQGLTDEQILAIDAKSPYANEYRTELIKSQLKSIRGQ